MSVEAITWALAQKMDRSSAKFVLVALANCCGTEMTCWPSSQYLCDATCQDRKTVLDNLRRLRDAGFISDTGERKGTTGQIIVYRLNDTENGTVKESRKRNDTENGTVPFFRANSPENGTGNSPENGTRNRHRNRKEPSVPLAQSFARFYAAYPKHRSRGSAERAWARLNPDEQLMQAILASIERAKTSEKWLEDGGRYIPYPATWLRAKGWEDEEVSVDPILMQIRERYPDTVPDGRGYYDPGTRMRFDSRGEMVVV